MCCGFLFLKRVFMAKKTFAFWLPGNCRAQQMIFKKFQLKDIVGSYLA